MISSAAQAANQGSMLGVGMALAGAVPGSSFAGAMSKVSAVSSAISAANQGSPMSAVMALAGIAPDSPIAQALGQISQATDIVKQGMAILNPDVDPTVLIKSMQPQAPATQSLNIQSGPPGARIKGEGLRCEACALANQEAQIGAPVNALYGSKILAGGDDIDYSGHGYLPFTMSRIYNSQNPDTGWFGQGWVTQGYEQRLELDPQHNRIYLIDNTGRRVPFTYLAPGQHCYQPSEGITLYRKPLADDKKNTVASARPIIAGATSGSRIGDHEPLEFIIYPGNYHHSDTRPDHFNGIAQHYSYVSSRRHYGTKAVVRLSSYMDKYGHQIQLHYTRSALQSDAHIPQYLTDEGGGCYEFEFITINKQTRLAKLYQIKDRQEKTVLADYSYSKEGDLIKVTKRSQITREFAYKAHLMTWQTQANGQQVAYQYNQYDNPKAARIIEQVISSGRHYLFEYGRDTGGIDSIGTTTVTEQPGTELERTRHYSYDDWYNMTSITDPNGNTTLYEYDDHNRTTKVTRANNSHTNYNYQGNHLNSVQVQTGIDSITQLPKYREVSYEYNKAGQLIAGTDALGNQQQYRYNQRGEMIKNIDALGHSTHLQHDEHGNLTIQTLANGSQFSFKYDDYGNLLTQTDCSGYQTQYQYDDKQRLLQITDAESACTRYYYRNNAPHLEELISQVRYPDGSQIQMDYDDLGRLTTYTDALGQQVTYQYDSAGKPSKRMEHRVKEAGTVKRFNAKGNSIAYHYDALKRLTTLINENNEQWIFEYDANDNLISETRFDGHQSRYHYDNIGQHTQKIDNPQLPRHQQQHVLMDYDLAGQLITKHSSHYPELIGAQSKAPRAQYHRMRYDYDELGQLISAVNPSSRTSLVYDASGRLIEETLISHLTQAGQYQAREQTLQHQYDELGNRTATTLPDGKVINQLYYGSGHLYNQSLHDPSTDEYIELRHSERNKLHLEISRQQGALESSYDYDPMGRLTKQHSTNNEHLTIQRDYHYDALGQLTHLSGRSVLQSEKRNQQNVSNNQNTFTRNHQYQYDTLGRLTEHKLTDYQNHTGITEVFAFDPASNRVPVSVADDTKDKTQSDHGRPRELIQNGKRIRYTYDSHDRVLYKTTEPVDKDNRPIKQSNHSLLAYRQALQLQYNANNELEESLCTQYQGNKVIKTQTVYHYDAFGRRIHKHSETRNFTQSSEQLSQTNKTQHQHTHMLWDSDLPIQEYSDTHVYTTIYDQGSFKPIARLMWLREDIPQPVNDEPEVVQDNPHIKIKVEPKSKVQVYHYHNDQLGTPNELTDDKGEIVWLADYEAWGNTAKEIWREEKLKRLKVSADELQPIRFQGQHYDIETGLHYNRFRYYDPDMGMFTTRDPIGLMGGDNVFQYAPNPTGFIDPLGLEKGPYGLGGGPYSQYNTIRRNKIDWGVSKSISNWRKNPYGPFGGVCGAEGTTEATWVPDSVWTNECAEHDRCYSDCSKTKYQCDGAFFRTGAPLQSIALQTVFKKDSTKAYKDAQLKAGCCNDCIK